MHICLMQSNEKAGHTEGGPRHLQQLVSQTSSGLLYVPLDVLQRLCYSSHPASGATNSQALSLQSQSK